MTKPTLKTPDQEILEILGDIKKLIILQLVKGGTPVPSEEVGATLGITGRTIRKVATTVKKPRHHG